MALLTSDFGPSSDYGFAIVFLRPWLWLCYRLIWSHQRQWLCCRLIWALQQLWLSCRLILGPSVTMDLLSSYWGPPATMALLSSYLVLRAKKSPPSHSLSVFLPSVSQVHARLYSLECWGRGWGRLMEEPWEQNTVVFALIVTGLTSKCVWLGTPPPHPHTSRFLYNSCKDDSALFSTFIHG